MPKIIKRPKIIQCPAPGRLVGPMAFKLTFKLRVYNTLISVNVR